MSRPIVLIVVVGLVARLAMFALFGPLPNLMSGDTSLFVAQSHDPLKFGFEPPGYPLFLSVVLPFGAVAVIATQMLVTLGSAIFTYVRIGGRPGLILALAIAACPFFIIFEFRLLTEMLACQLVWVGLLLLGWPRRRWEPVAAGVAFGFAALTRDTLYLMPLLLPLVVIRTPKFRSALVACILAFLTVLPWQLAGGTTKISDGRGGFALWIGTWERNADWQLPGIPNAAWPADAFRSPSEKQRVIAAIRARDDSPLAEIAINRIRTQPIRVLEAWAFRYPRLWIGTRTDYLPMRVTGAAWFTFKLAFFALNLGLLALALIGAWQLRKDAKARLVAAPIVYLAVVLIPFHNTETRYSLPAVASLLFFAVHAVTAFTTAKLKTRASDNEPPDRFSTAMTNDPEDTLSIQ